MYTYNMIHVIMNGPAVTLVCASENPINEEQLEQSMLGHWEEVEKSDKPFTFSDATNYVIDSIRQEYGCECVKIEADSVLVSGFYEGGLPQ